MKIRMRRLQLFILLFAASSLLFHPPLDFEAFAVDGDTITESVEALTHDSAHDSGFCNSLVQVDSDTYALATAGENNKTPVVITFTIPSDGSSITEVTKVATGVGQNACSNKNNNSLIQVDSDTYAWAHQGNAATGSVLTTITINADGTGSKVESLTHDSTGGGSNSLVQVDSDTYALAYTGADDDGFISTFTIDSSGDITAVKTQSEGNNLEHDTDNAEFNSLVQVDSDTYALAYTGTDDDGFISTFTIDSSGNITAVKTQSEGNNLEHDTEEARHNSLVQVDSDTYMLAYQGTGTGEISTFTIDSSGNITAILTQSEGNNLEHHTKRSDFNSLVQVDSDTYALAYRDTASGHSSKGAITAFNISTDAPTVVITSSSGDTGDTVSSTTLSYTATFSESTSNFVVGDITVTGTANGGSPAASNFAGSGTTYTFDVVQGSSDGTVSVSIAAGVATDGSDDNIASNTYALTIDTAGPSVTITSSNGASGSSVSATTLSYTATFNESVSNFVVGDITVTGTASANLSNFAGSGTTYTFDVVKDSTDGNVHVKIASGVASDASGNNNITSNTYSFTPVTWVDATTTSAAAASTGSTCSRHIILGNCGTIAINNDEYRIIDTWTDVPTTEVLVGEPVTVILSTPNNPTYTKIHFASVFTEIFDSPTNYEQSTHVDYSVMNSKVTYVSQSQLFQVAGATHRVTEDPNTRNLDRFEVVFTMIFAKPMDTSHIVVETENKFGIPETLYLTSALKVNENLQQSLTLEEKSKFELEYEPVIDKITCGEGTVLKNNTCVPELIMDTEVKVTCGEGTVLKNNLCVPKEWSFLDFFEQLMKLFD